MYTASLRYNALIIESSDLILQPTDITETILNYPLCKTDEISDPGSKSFEVRHGRKNISLFVVHKDGAFKAYINSCPHTGANLDWQEDQFLDMDNMFIQCSTHDALFEIDTGACIAGPCIGDNLDAIDLVIEDGQISVQL
jgi:nitrite reductase/ring-hydroxylating ferredoxin subunit